ncbi:hypothetical protein ACFX13_010138 [Malus domestica]
MVVVVHMVAAMVVSVRLVSGRCREPRNKTQIRTVPNNQSNSNQDETLLNYPFAILLVLREPRFNFIGEKKSRDLVNWVGGGTCFLKRVGFTFGWLKLYGADEVGANGWEPMRKS